MVDSLARIKYPSSWNIKRNPARPKDLQILNFDHNYDYETLWNDAIQINQTTILLVGPPLYETARLLQDRCNFLDQLGQVMPVQIIEMDRACITQLSTNRWNDHITLANPIESIQIPVQKPSTDFAGKKVIVTISKNHPVAWLKQWIDYHKVVHNVEGLLLYNNQSTIYTSSELETQLARNDMTIRVLDYDVPFGVMGGGYWEWEGRTGNFLPWDSDFSQYVMLEHAKWRYLYNAKLVLNSDTDELLLLDNGTLDDMANYCETSSNSVWLYQGIWIEPVDSKTGIVAEDLTYQSRRFENYWHTAYSNQRGIGVKWMLNPQKNIQYQWMLHRTTGPHMMTKEISFGHYLAMNTSWSWKRDSYNDDRSKLVEHLQLKKNLKKWNPNLGE